MPFTRTQIKNLYQPVVKHIQQYVYFLRKEPPKVLGRWVYLDNRKQMDHRIDLANEDKCGPCGNSNHNKYEEIKKKK